MVDSNAFLDAMEGFVDDIQEFLVAIQDFLDAIQEPDLDAIQVFLDDIQDFFGCHTRAMETKNVLFMVYPVYFLRVYPPIHGIAESRKKMYTKLGNHGKIMQRKFCMACMEPYMALGYGCQEGQHGSIQIDGTNSSNVINVQQIAKNYTKHVDINIAGE